MGVPAKGLVFGRSNSIFRFGSDPYILQDCERTRGMGLVGESNEGKYGTAGGIKFRFGNPRGVGVPALCSLAPAGVRSSCTAAER